MGRLKNMKTIKIRKSWNNNEQNCHNCECYIQFKDYVFSGKWDGQYEYQFCSESCVVYGEGECKLIIDDRTK